MSAGASPKPVAATPLAAPAGIVNPGEVPAPAAAPTAIPLDFGEVESGRELGPPTLSVPERIALDTHGIRKLVAFCLTGAFVVINGFVMYGLYIALNFDFQMLAKQPNYVPFINHEVIMSVLGATTVQLGAVTYTMVKFLFPATRA